MRRQSLRPATWPILLLGVLLAMGLMACRATEEVKQGYVGEHCNGIDLDCRAPLICDQSVCRSSLTETGVTCERMCERLDFCETNEVNCLPKCRNTIREWSAEAVESFGDCVIDGLSCEEAREVDAPQYCYEQIPIADGRRDRCQYFIDAARSCNASVSTQSLRNNCLFMARTRSQEVWSRTDACVERVEEGFCVEIADCLNELFSPSPSLQL